MNLRSGTSVELKVRDKENKQTNKDACSMAKIAEIKQMFEELKDSLCKEFQEHKDELKQFRNDTERDIKTIMERTTDLRQKVEETIPRVDHLESRVSDIEDADINTQQTAKEVQSRVDALVEIVDYLENKSRQNNLCIYNIPEKSEGGDMTAFLGQLMGEILGISEELGIVRAHRISKERQEFERPIIVSFFNSDTKARVLHAAWKKKEVLYKDKRIYFDHDFSSAVRKQRSLYKPIRQQLKAQNIKTHILAPAKLKVFNEDGTTIIF